CLLHDTEKVSFCKGPGAGCQWERLKTRAKRRNGESTRERVKVRVVAVVLLPSTSPLCLSPTRGERIHTENAGEIYLLTGLNNGIEISGVASSNVTSTGMPIFTSSGLQSTTFVSMRTPSSSSTYAMIYGRLSRNPALWF